MHGVKDKKGGNEWMSTRYEGVQQRVSWSKRFRGKPDVSYRISYTDPITGKRVRPTVGKRSHGMTAETASAMRAQILTKAREQLRDGDTYVPPAKPLMLGQAWDLYRVDWLDAQGKSTLKDDSYMFDKHLLHLSMAPLSAITPHVLDQLTGELRGKGLSSQSVKHVLALLRRIMRRMVKWRKWRGVMPFEDFEMPRVNNARQRVLTPYEAKALLEALAITTPRMSEMSFIALHCGLRFGEVAALTRSDVNFEQMTLLLRDPKAEEDRFAIMTPTVARLIRQILDAGNGHLLFPSRTGEVMSQPSDAFARTVKALGLNDSAEIGPDNLPVEIMDNRLRVVFHTWRHTYGSWLGEAGDGQETIADRLGHSSVEMSERYTHVFSPTRRRTALTIEHMFNHESPPPREIVDLRADRR